MNEEKFYQNQKQLLAIAILIEKEFERRNKAINDEGIYREDTISEVAFDVLMSNFA